MASGCGAVFAASHELYDDLSWWDEPWRQVSRWYWHGASDAADRIAAARARDQLIAEGVDRETHRRHLAAIRARGGLILR